MLLCTARPFLSKDPKILFTGFFQIEPQVRFEPLCPVLPPTEQMGKPTAPPSPLVVEPSRDPAAQTPMPPAAIEAMSLVLKDKSSSCYKFEEKIEEIDEEEHSGPEEAEEGERGE